MSKNNVKSNDRDRSNNTNRNARIETHLTKTGRIRTETRRRDRGSLVASALTNPDTNRTTFYIGRAGAGFSLNGREARTLFRVLQRHYEATGNDAA